MPAQRMRSDLERVARRPFNILITGETGTGKTQMARQIHRMSVRTNKPFVELNCANLPEHLVEAELFGHRKGAFTGADHDRKGLFEEADGGILFLDEIGDIPLTVQNRLLKAIDEKQIKRLGTNYYRGFDVQIIAATSRNLVSMIAAGEFREDLHCRLAVLTVHAYPLRERRDDIPAMITRFLREASDAVTSEHNGREWYRINKEALELLVEFEHPGNIRALRNLIYEITSYVELCEPISISLVEAVLTRVDYRGTVRRKIESNNTNSPPAADIVPAADFKLLPFTEFHSWVESIAHEGDIVLPLELCVLRRGETFRQWTARAKRYSIEAATQVTGGTQSAAERLGLTCNSLKSHLKRARRNQNQNLFD